MSKDLFTLKAYHYDLPKDLIARRPPKKREDSRLMIVDRASGEISERPFSDFPKLLNSNDHLIFNDTKVIPARLLGVRETGGKAEMFLVEECAENVWKILAKPAKKLSEGAVVHFPGGCQGKVIECLKEGMRKVQFECEGSFSDWLHTYGKIPLPPYMEREADEEDRKRYQTVFAKHEGAVAAPTAALHFSDGIFKEIKKRGVESHFVTLHVGLGTFQPVYAEDIREHIMHYEKAVISKETAKRLNESTGRFICVGTTSCRTLESATNENREVRSGSLDTNLFIYPGYKFRFVDAMLTNFHLPGSTLLMMISAFAGHELIQEAYAKAIEKKFRFFSYGDAMLIV